MGNVLEVTGWIAHGLLVGAWLVMMRNAVLYSRKGVRSRDTVVKVFAIQTTVLVVLAAAVTEIHFLATDVWQVVVAVVLTAVALYVLRKRYRQLVAPPRHRINGLPGLVNIPHQRTSSNSHVAPRWWRV